MSALSAGLRHRAGAFVESMKRLGRYSPATPNKHADSDLSQMRRWSAADIMFDVGANDGRTILRLRPLLGGARVYAFEPVPAAYQKLVARTRDLPDVRTFRHALGAASGAGEMYVADADALSSFSPVWTDRATSRVVVDIRTIDEVVEREAIERIHFLKIDTEGYELEVLKGAEQTLRASRVEILQLEVGVDQLSKKMLSLEQARCYLRERGYLLYGVYNQCHTPARPPDSWPPDERLVFRSRVLAYCDALFIRADL